jgi:hypothetical protein
MPFQMSMVLFREAPRLSATELQSALANHWPDLPVATEVSEQGIALSLRIGAADVVIGKMPAPVPWSDLEGPCATSVLWPDAEAAIRGHTNHAIVTVNGELSPVELSTLLTQTTAALMVSSPESIGVFWTNATMVVPKDLFFSFATEVLPLGPPLLIWVDCRVGWAESETISAGFTTGLAELGLMELETQTATEAPSELRKRFEAIAGYLLENGPVIGDGDSLGDSEAEKIRVVYTDSKFGAKGPVMNLCYEPATPKKSWWT